MNGDTHFLSVAGKDLTQEGLERYLYGNEVLYPVKIGAGSSFVVRVVDDHGFTAEAITMRLSTGLIGSRIHDNESDALDQAVMLARRERV